MLLAAHHQEDQLLETPIAVYTELTVHMMSIKPARNM
jgi:hypothetical protein